MNLSADALALFSDFGVDATLNGTAVRGLFDEASAAGMNNMMLGSNPTFICASASASIASRGKTLVVGGVSYTVTAVKPDSTGFTSLELEEV